MKYGTKTAGIPIELIEKISRNSINSKSVLTITASFVSGLPGGLVGLLGGSSVDVMQYYANFFNLAQKLMYLYGYKDISDLDSSQEDIMIVVMGVASGVEVAMLFLKRFLPKPLLNGRKKLLQNRQAKVHLKLFRRK